MGLGASFLNTELHLSVPKKVPPYSWNSPWSKPDTFCPTIISGMLVIPSGGAWVPRSLRTIALPPACSFSYPEKHGLEPPLRSYERAPWAWYPDGGREGLCTSAFLLPKGQPSIPALKQNRTTLLCSLYYLKIMLSETEQINQVEHRFAPFFIQNKQTNSNNK